MVIMSVVAALITLVLAVVVVLSLVGALAILVVTVGAISLVATVGRRGLIFGCRLIHKPDHNMHGIVSYLWYRFHPEKNCKNKMNVNMQSWINMHIHTVTTAATVVCGLQ